MRYCFTILGLMLFSITISKAQDNVEGQLLGITLIQAAANFSLVNDSYGNLKEGYYRDHKIYLYAGRYYEINAVCDRDCTNLNLKLYDGMGNLISYDTSYHALPAVTVSVYSSGYFTLRVSMKSCHVEPCKYGFGIYK